MGALSRPLTASAATEMRWIQVEEPSAVGACRSAAQQMMAQLSFSARRTADVALAVTEAASNLHKHARQGAALLRINRDAPVPGIELVTIDAGPGLGNASVAFRDGHSTAGTLGIGLGAIRRLADTCDVYSAPGHGTALAARFWPVPGQSPLRCAGLIRPISGEFECGDAFSVVAAGDRMTGIMTDGLGHGPLAATAARESLAVLEEDPVAAPAVLLERVHRRLGRTRGGAVAIVSVAGGIAQFAGLGNIGAWILSGDSRIGMLSVPGIAGHQARTIRQFDYAVPPGAAIVLHSDGLSSRWDARALPGLDSTDPLIIAAALLAEAGVHRDDAGIIVLKP